MPDIIADFHGTLYQDADEGPLWGYVAKQAVKPAQALRHPLRTIAFAKAKSVLEELTERYKRGEIGYDKIYEAYNRLVLSYLPREFVYEAILSFASLPETRQKLDGRVLRPIKDSTGRKGILSTGSIEFILNLMPVDYGFPRHTISANGISRNGRGSAFNLRVYGNKPQIIERVFFEELRFIPWETVYFGDNKDEEPAFEYVTSLKGKVVIPFYATDAFKQHAAIKYKAEVPKNEQELSRFLKSLK